MPKRKQPLICGEIYHIFSKSIAGFDIFRNVSEYERMRDVFRYYKMDNLSSRFSFFLRMKDREKFYKDCSSKGKNLVEIIAYCLIPTHMHLILKQLQPNGISIFMSNICNSYTRYFNIKTKRKGPLWESRFKNVLVKTDGELLHFTRYVHLNPVTAYLVEKPEDWEFSSYKEFLGKVDQEKRMCNYSDLLEIKPKNYREFVNSRIKYQRELARIKKLLEN